MRDWSELTGEGGVRGLIMVGSLARGEADHYSDLDLKRYWNGSRAVSHQLLPWGSRLLSLTDMGLDDAWAQLADPEGWVWAASGLRLARILHDPYGEMAALQTQAMGDCPPGREWGLTQLEGWCEEVHKLLGALAAGDEEKVLGARFGLVDGLTMIAAVELALPIVTENRIYAEVRALMPPAWGQAQRAALDGDTRSALRLFLETAARFPSTPVLELTRTRLREPVVGHLKASHRDIYNGMRRDLWPDCQEQEIDLLLDPDDQLQDAARYRAYLAQEALTGETLGLVELGLHAGRRGHLEGLYVRPEYRGRGVGAALVRWAIAELGRWGCAEITSDTWADQQVSRRLHLRCGFVAVDEDEREVRFAYRGPPLWPSA